MSILNRAVENVLAAERTSSGTLVSGQGRLRGFMIRDTASAGTAVFKDGGSSGTTILTVDTPAGVGELAYQIPGGGIKFSTDLYVTLTNADAVTVFYAAGE